MAESHRLVNPRKIYVKDLNDNLTCSLCGGYLIDATTVVDCSHTFCRACIVRHFESSRLCPNCGSLVHKSKPLTKLRSDTTLQSLIYKVIPSLYNKELQRRADFYHSTGFRSNSACSDDSVLGDRSLDTEEWVISNVGDPSLYFSPDDSISLSVEYYRAEIIENSETSTPPSKSETIKTDCEKSDKKCASNDNNKEQNGGSDIQSLKSDEKNSDGQNSISDLKTDCKPEQNEKISCVIASDVDNSGFIGNDMSHKRFLQCPAAVRMCHLMKFLRMKFALSNEHRVDIIYKGEVLPPYLSLMDVAYSFKWLRDSPMRFFYLIYIPVPTAIVPPQQQVASVTTPLIPPLKIEISNNIKLDSKNLALALSVDDRNVTPDLKINSETTEEIKKEDNNNLKTNTKSVKFSDKPTNSELKSYQKSVKFNDFKTTNYAYKVKTNDSIKDVAAENCVYDYAEPDKDEIKAFAERRDREWALQKYQDSQFHVSKKRKKNKHSKNEFMHKKRKLHAEITNEISSKSDDSLKLKVKLSVPNGHKHKHRNSNSNVEQPKIQELSPKERLLQMRQVRHKHINNPQGVEEKSSLKLNSEKSDSAENSERSKQEVDQTKTEVVTKGETTQKSDQVTKQDPVSKTPEKITKSTEPPQPQRTPPEILSTGKTLRSDFSFKTSLSKDICNKYVRVNLEKCAESKNSQKKSPVNNSGVKIFDNKQDDKVVKNDLNNKTEIIPIENKQSQNNKPLVNNANSKVIESKMYGNKIAVENSKLNNTNHAINDKMSNKLIEDKKVISNIKLSDENKKKISDNFSMTSNKSVENNKQQPSNKIDTTKLVPKQIESKTVDESKTIENKLNNITSQSSLVTKNFTVSKVETGIKRKLDTAESSNDKRPSLEITVINVVSRPQTSTVQTNPVQSKPKINNQITKSLSITPEGPPAKKIRPPPLTIPLGRIQKMNNLKTNPAQKPPEKCDIFGPLDLSAKPNTLKPDAKISNDFRSHSASPKPKIQDQIQSLIRPKTPIKTQDVKNDNLKNRPNISNLQMLSESAVQIREMMAKGSPISSIPNLIKKIPSPQNTVKSDFLPKPNFHQKTPNLIPKTANNQLPKTLNNFTPKSPQFISKNLQKLPKLNEINKSQFCRLNATAQIRSPRPAGQNQTVRNIPNPSLLVRQQNQNRINSLNTTVSQNQDNNSSKVQDALKIKPENETDRKTEKNSEPPPLKPIESFKK